MASIAGETWSQVIYEGMPISHEIVARVDAEQFDTVIFESERLAIGPVVENVVDGDFIGNSTPAPGNTVTMDAYGRLTVAASAIDAYGRLSVTVTP